MFNKVFVVSPANIATGGTELLQQLVYKLRLFGVNAYMFYTTPYEASAVKRTFEPRYNNPIANDIEDHGDNIVIVPESGISSLLKYRNIQKAVWWLSVDNYQGTNKKKKDFLHTVYRYCLDMFYRYVDKRWIHFVQSEYAYLYCSENRRIPQSHIFRLSDYLSSGFIESVGNVNTFERKNQVLYNPLKGKVFTEKLIEMNPDLNWVPIQNMTAEQVRNLMLSSKVYVDFGNHPGKDRIPREAAMCGLCVITGKKGSAANDIDVEIPRKYKFDEIQISEISKVIHSCLNDYDVVIGDFTNYRNKIMHEEQVFNDEIKAFFLS